jgi:DNA replication protein DnaC
MGMLRSFNTICNHCKKNSVIQLDISDLFANALPQPIIGVCPDCSAVLDDENRAEFNRMHEKEILEKARIPKEFLNFDKSKGNMDLARFVWQNRANSMMLFGAVGSGKSRCVCRAAKELILSGKKVEYWSFQDLAGRYTALQQEGSEHGRKFVRNLFTWNDITIIDDIDKKRYSESVCELLYAIFDGIYAGTFAGKIWVTANFANGEEMHRKFENGDIADAVCSRVDRMAQDGRMKLWR